MATIRLVHCSYHKCLTVYFKRVMQMVFNRCLPWSRGYRHFNSHLEEFYAGSGGLRVASVNNRFLDRERLGRCRISRFIRDPRDLIVSGYFYHRRGAESWTTLRAPTEADWYFANGCVPQELRASGCSFSEYLQSVPEEEGLLAELEFRRYHFESMAAWPRHHPDIATFRYEEIGGDEARVFRELSTLYGLSSLERALVVRFAKRYSLDSLVPDAHVRDPTTGQWRRYFTAPVRRAFDARYPGLVKQLGYPED